MASLSPRPVRRSAEGCLAVASGRVFGSRDNVGRTLRKKLQPRIVEYNGTDRLKVDKVKEIMLDADRLPNRLLPISVVENVLAFSEADAQLVREHLGRTEASVKVSVDPKAGYVEGQGRSPGAGFLAKTRLYYEAIWAADAGRQQSLRLDLQTNCFD